MDMSWRDFANHFLSNQRQHAQSWINKTFLGNYFWWETWLWVFWPFPFLFLFRVGWKSHWRKRFWLVIKKRTASCVASHGFLSFISCLWQSCTLFRNCLVWRPFCIFSFVFFQSLIGNFFSSFVLRRSSTVNSFYVPLVVLICFAYFLFSFHFYFFFFFFSLLIVQ